MASGKIKDDSNVRISLCTFFFAISIGISWLILYGAEKSGDNQLNVRGIFIFLLACTLPIVPGVLLWQLLNYWSSFGKSILTLDSIPTKMGTKTSGDITVSKPITDFTAINVRVYCNQVISGGRSRRTILLWDIEQSVDANTVQQFGQQMIIPVTLTIPVGLKPTKKSQFLVMKFVGVFKPKLFLVMDSIFAYFFFASRSS